VYTNFWVIRKKFHHFLKHFSYCYRQISLNFIALCTVSWPRHFITVLIHINLSLLLFFDIYTVSQKDDHIKQLLITVTVLFWFLQSFTRANASPISTIAQSHQCTSVLPKLSSYLVLWKWHGPQSKQISYYFVWHITKAQIFVRALIC